MENSCYRQDCCGHYNFCLLLPSSEWVKKTFFPFLLSLLPDLLAGAFPTQPYSPLQRQLAAIPHCIWIQWNFSDANSDFQTLRYLEQEMIKKVCGKRKVFEKVNHKSDWALNSLKDRDHSFFLFPTEKWKRNGRDPGKNCKVYVA